MRYVLALGVALAAAVALGACSGGGGQPGCDYKGHHHVRGEVFPDDCNTCVCTADGAECTKIACGPHPDANLASCAPAEVCPVGVACGAYCCNAGERCTEAGCMCGTRAACPAGDTCASPGPSGGDTCGTICCGKSGPCPQ